uniref:SRCR domain-containing protein n=1 Tax=Heterorhabditis bacteriophora TaxID=37862 RepID=A0A1I7WHU7_HETBA
MWHVTCSWPDSIMQINSFSCICIYIFIYFVLMLLF